MFFAILVFLSLPSTTRYRFTLQAVDNANGAYEVIRIYSTKSNKLLFTKRYNDDSLQMPQWSPDGKQLAWTKDVGWDVSVWRADIGLRRIPVKNPWPDDYGEPEYDNYPKWSPDSKRLLLKIPMVQGEYDLKTGALVCLDLTTRQSVRIAFNVCDVEWLNSRTVKYCTKVYREAPQAPIVKWRLWKAKH